MSLSSNGLVLVCKVLCLFVLSVSITTTVAEETFENDFRIAGYLPDYRFYINVEAMAPFLTDLFLFSVAPDSSDDNLRKCCLHSDHYNTARKARALKTQGAKLRLWVTVGGGGRSFGFSNLFLTTSSGSRERPSKRDEARRVQKFVTSLTQLVEDEAMDGVIFDCEHFSSQEDYYGYLRFLQLSVKKLHPQLGIAVALHIDQFLTQDLYNSLHYIHLMAYDIGGSPPFHADMAKVQRGVTKLIESGCPPGKILLGIPSYGRHAKHLGQVKTFAEIFDAIQEEGGTDLSYTGDWNGFLYESPKGIQEKVGFAQRHGLAGVFFWELGQDKQTTEAPGGILLVSAASASTIPTNEKHDEL